MENKPRRPWLAGVLTFFALGLGHLYLGDLKKGVSLFFPLLLLLILANSFLLLYLPAWPIILIIAIAYTVYCIIDAVKGARVFKDYYLMKRVNRWYIYLFYWVAFTIIVELFQTTVKANIVQAYKIPASSMMETIQIGDHVLANKLIYKISEPKRGDIIIFPFPKDPSKDFIKRIIGLGGETIEIKDKTVIVNGNVLQEPYAFYSDTGAMRNFGPVTIPKDSLFVMGDNRDNSEDSRYWGFLKTVTVKGKATKIYWSWDYEKQRVRWNRTGKEIN
jgi:signal peptidase I